MPRPRTWAYDAHGHVTRAISCENFEEKCRGPESVPRSNPALNPYRENPSVWTHCFGSKRPLIYCRSLFPCGGSQSRVSPGLASTGGLSQGHHAICGLGRLLRGKQDGSHFWAFVGQEITHSVTGGLGWGVKRPKNNSIFGCFSKKLHKRLLSLQVQQTLPFGKNTGTGWLTSCHLWGPAAFFAILYVSPYELIFTEEVCLEACS